MILDSFEKPVEMTYYDVVTLFFVFVFFSEGCRLWQDNDPKHVSRATKDFMTAKGINWWPTPAQSPVIVEL